MSKLKQYFLLGGIIFLIQWSPVRQMLQSSTFLNVVWGIIGFLLIVAVIVTWPGIKKKLKERKKHSFREDDERF